MSAYKQLLEEVHFVTERYSNYDISSIFDAFFELNDNKPEAKQINANQKIYLVFLFIIIEQVLFPVITNALKDALFPKMKDIFYRAINKKEIDKEEIQELIDDINDKLEDTSPEFQKQVRDMITQQTIALKTKKLKVVLKDMKNQLEYAKRTMQPFNYSV